MKAILTKNQISSALDITEPFLMISDWEEVETGKIAVGSWQLDEKDWFLKCHLPDTKAMPATLLIEGMLQTLVLLIYRSEPHGEHRSFVTGSKVRFFAAPKPGYAISYRAELQSFRRGIAKGRVTASSDGRDLCSGEFAYASPHLMGVPFAKHS